MILPVDASLVDVAFAACTVLDRALATLGYLRAAEGHYRHDRLPYMLAFPIGPLAIGREYITAWRTERRDDRVLHVYTPTDVVRDRFLHYWAWGDRTALDVALAVARAHPAEIDLAAFTAWTARELAADPSYDPSRIGRFLSSLQ